MKGALVGGELSCRVCGLPQDEAIWGPDGTTPTYDICPCCGCEFGYEDCLPEGIRRHREKWLASATWFDPAKQPEGWSQREQIGNAPQFYFRVLPGLPGTGSPPVTFNVTGTAVHSEGFVVEFTLRTGRSWIGNFQTGPYGASGVLAVLGRADQALVLAEGQAYVVEPETATIVRSFGGLITDVFNLRDRGSMIFGNGLWFECIGADGLRWRTRRLSWDGTTEVALNGMRLRGQAANIDDTWVPFEVDVNTGEVTGGSYPPDLPQP
jgi:hypothetical protein